MTRWAGGVGRGVPNLHGRLADFSKAGAKSRLHTHLVGQIYTSAWANRGVHSSLWPSGPGMAWGQQALVTVGETETRAWTTEVPWLLPLGVHLPSTSVPC